MHFQTKFAFAPRKTLLVKNVLTHEKATIDKIVMRSFLRKVIVIPIINLMMKMMFIRNSTMRLPLFK